MMLGRKEGSSFYESRYTGLFAQLSLIQAEPSDPDVFLFGAEIPKNALRPQKLILGGAGFTQQAAKAACIGEAIERYACYPVPTDGIIHSSYQNWSYHEPLVSPKDWVLFHPDQYTKPNFPFVPFQEQTVCDWVCFRQAGNGQAMWVPCEFSYLYPKPQGYHQFSPAVSTGLACGKAFDPVLLRGLQEVIERDALMGAFWGNYPLEEYPLDQVLIGLLPEVAHRILRPHLTYQCYRIRSPFSDNVCVVTMAGETRAGFCRSVGSACRETPLQSFEKAIIEAIQGFHYVRYLKSEIQQTRRILPADCHDFADHAVYYSLFPAQWNETVFARAKLTVIQLENKLESLKSLEAKLGQKHPILFRNVTPPEIAQKKDDYVLKVVVPGLQPMHGNDHFPHLGGRLWAHRNIVEFEQIRTHPFP